MDPTNALKLTDRTNVSYWIKGMHLCNMKRRDHDGWCTDITPETGQTDPGYQEQIRRNEQCNVRD